MAKRFIKLYEQITNWEWFRHPNTLCLFIYLLLKANYKDLVVHGRVIKRGQLVTSLPKISTDTGLTIQQTRTALSHLKSTGEITDESTSQIRVITVVKYDCYQTATDKSTGNQHATNRRPNRQSTDELTPSIEYIDNIENIERKNNKSSSKTLLFRPPTLTEVEDYCSARGNDLVDPQQFIDYNEARGWVLSNGRKMVDWKAAIRTWERNELERRKKNPKYYDDLPF